MTNTEPKDPAPRRHSGYWTDDQTPQAAYARRGDLTLGNDDDVPLDGDPTVAYPPEVLQWLTRKVVR